MHCFLGNVEFSCVPPSPLTGRFGLEWVGRLHLYLFALFLLVGVSLPAFAQLPRPAALSKHIEFWVRVYTEVSGQQALVHDARYPDIIYEKVDLPSGSGYSSAHHRASRKSRRGRGIASRSDTLRESRQKWRRVLLSLHEKESNYGRPLMGVTQGIELSGDELKAIGLFREHTEPDRFLRAANRRRLRTQIGSRESFAVGIATATQYLPRMEPIFREEGLPVELTRLPLVESSFNLKAVSKVGASGIWQFMRSTGKVYLRVDDEVDERNDPILATRAAAKLFKANYALLQDWPLAVTAYNHGRKSILRLIRAQGVDSFEEGVLQSRLRRMGFASRNFYACLLAAIDVYEASRGQSPEKQAQGH